MTTAETDRLIINLATTCFTGMEQFEQAAKLAGQQISVKDLDYLRKKLHEPPTAPPEIESRELRLGEWLAYCQAAIFELIYQLNTGALAFFNNLAYGDYDWTQANALHSICRLYLDRHISAEHIHNINKQLPKMRHETTLYFAQDLLARKKHDQRVEEIFQLLPTLTFRLALEELGHHTPMTREELIALGNKIMTGDESEAELTEMMELFDAKVPYPGGSGLFYYPENYNANTDDISGYAPTAEEVVDKCLSFKPIN